MLARLGIDERAAREHSIEWLQETLRELRRQELAQLSRDMKLAFIAAQAAQHGGEAFDHFVETVEALNEAAGIGDEPYTDEDAIRALAQQKPDAFQQVSVLQGGVDANA